jgi:hypothetical protein
VSYGSGSQAQGLQIAPLVLYKSANDPETTRAEQNQAPQIEATNMLAGHIRMAWQRNKLYKEKVQLELLNDLRAKENTFSAAEIEAMQRNGGANFVWIPITETKCRAASAWVREILMPVGDRAWQLTASPLPEMPPEFKITLLEQATERARQAMADQQQAGGGIMTREQFREQAWEMHNQIHDEVLKHARKAAAAAAERMEDKVEEQMDDGGFEVAMDEFIEDFVVYKAAIMCGPVFERRRVLKWLPGWKVGTDDSPRPTWKRIDPFDAFPAMFARDCQKGDFIVRLRYRRDELYDMIGVEGYREDLIRECLRAFANGHLEAWLWTEAERQRLQNETMYTFLSPWGVIDALWYWGSVPGWKLMSWGLLEDQGQPIDPVREYEVEAQVIGPYVIMCRVNPDPLRRRPFHKACYSAKPGGFWGKSIPELCRTSQKMCNAAASALADNMGMASGPMLWVHNDRLADGESALDVYAWRVFQLKSDPTQGVNPGIGVLITPDISEKLQAIVDKYDQRADDDSGIPRYTYGNEQVGGAADTYSGLSMLMNNAAKGLRRAIASVDIGVFTPSLQMAYEYEMLWGKDMACKGDAYIEARGAAAILVKEAQRQGRMQALQLVGSSPVAMQVVGMTGYGKLLQNALRSIDGADDGVVPDDAALEKMQEQNQAQQAQQVQAQQAVHQADQQHETDLEQAKLDSKERIAGAQIGARKAEHPPPEQEFTYDQHGNIVGVRPKQPGPGGPPAPMPLAQPGRQNPPTRNPQPAPRTPAP